MATAMHIPSPKRKAGTRREAHASIAFFRSIHWLATLQPAQQDGERLRHNRGNSIPHSCAQNGTVCANPAQPRRNKGLEPKRSWEHPLTTLSSKPTPRSESGPAYHRATTHPSTPRPAGRTALLLIPRQRVPTLNPQDAAISLALMRDLAPTPDT